MELCPSSGILGYASGEFKQILNSNGFCMCNKDYCRTIWIESSI